MTRDEILAKSAGRYLDALIAERIFHYYDVPDHAHYSTNIADAWMVVEKMIEKYEFALEFNAEEFNLEWWAVFFLDDELESLFDAAAPNAPEAICKAALLAVMEEEK